MRVGSLVGYFPATGVKFFQDVSTVDKFRVQLWFRQKVERHEHAVTFVFLIGDG